MLDEGPKPLPKHIYDEAYSLMTRAIRLEFSGGSDEGYLEVELDFQSVAGVIDNFYERSKALQKAIEAWAWDAYSYSGAGDGNSYGDNITYDLETGKVKTREWYTDSVFEDEEEAECAIVADAEDD